QLLASRQGGGGLAQAALPQDQGAAGLNGIRSQTHRFCGVWLCQAFAFWICPDFTAIELPPRQAGPVRRSRRTDQKIRSFEVSMQDILQKLEEKRAQARAGGGEKRVAAQHARG